MAGEKPRSPKSEDAARAWGKTVEGQAVSIATEKASYAPGERIVLNIRFKNFGNTELRVRTMDSLYMYDVAVSLVGGTHRDAVFDGEHGPVRAIPESGKVPHTLFGKIRLEPAKGEAPSPSVLKPGQYRSVAVDLTRLFDFSLEGKYVVSVQGPVFKDGMFLWTDGRFQRTASNELEVTVDGHLGNPVVVNLGRGPKKTRTKRKAKRT